MELRRVSLRGGCWVSQWVPSKECGSEKAEMTWVVMTDKRWDNLMGYQMDQQMVEVKEHLINKQMVEVKALLMDQQMVIVKAQ